MSLLISSRLLSCDCKELLKRKAEEVAEVHLWVPLVIGLVLAFAALPYINYGVVCFIAPPLREKWLKKTGLIDDVFGWGPTIGLVVVPIYVVLLYTTVAMVRVYAWQCLWYLLALYITWGLYATFKVTAEGRSREPTWFNNPLIFVVPLQGFLNACVYFRPHVAQRWSKFLARRKERYSAEREERPDIPPARSEVGRAENTGGSEGSNFWGRLRMPACSRVFNDATDRYHDAEPAVDLVIVNSQVTHHNEPLTNACDADTLMESNENLAYPGIFEMQPKEATAQSAGISEMKMIEDVTAEGDADDAVKHNSSKEVVSTDCESGGIESLTKHLATTIIDEEREDPDAPDQQDDGHTCCLRASRSK